MQCFYQIQRSRVLVFDADVPSALPAFQNSRVLASICRRMIQYISRPESDRREQRERRNEQGIQVTGCFISHLNGALEWERSMSITRRKAQLLPPFGPDCTHRVSQIKESDDWISGQMIILPETNRVVTTGFDEERVCVCGQDFTS